MKNDYKDHKGDERRIRYTLEQLKEITSKSTQVVNWYPQCDGTVRGPYHRWLTVSKGNSEEHLSPMRDDAKYAGMAMNALPFLIEDKEKHEQIIEKLEQKLAKCQDMFYKIYDDNAFTYNNAFYGFVEKEFPERWDKLKSKENK